MSELKTEKLEFAPDYADVPGSDLILISSDGIGFKVLSKNLADSSEVFASMLDTCENDNVAGKEAVVILTESAETLNSILPFLSAKKMERIKTLEFPKSFDFIKALLKYELHQGLRVVTEILEKLTYLNTLSSSDLYHIYCYSFQTQDERLAHRAMIGIYQKDLTLNQAETLSESASFSAMARNPFLATWSKRALRAVELFKQTSIVHVCDKSPLNEWLQLATIHHHAVFERKLAGLSNSASCGTCRIYFGQAGRQVCKELATLQEQEDRAMN